VAEQDLPLAQPADPLTRRHRDDDDDVRSPRVAELCPRVGVLRVWVARRLPGARLDHDLEVLGGQRSDHVGDQRDATLALSGLFGYADLHTPGG
jgi:hypothetical protein